MVADTECTYQVIFKQLALLGLMDSSNPIKPASIKLDLNILKEYAFYQKDQVMP